MATDDKVGWFNRLLDLLPPLIRPRHDDQRFRDACHAAYANGWTPEQLAPVLTRRDYERVDNPPLILIMQLERVGERPLHPAAVAAAVPERVCDQGCVAGWRDPDPEPVNQLPTPPPRRTAYPTQQHPTTRPCPTCRPQLAARLANIPTPGHRNDTHHHYIRQHRTMR